MVPTLRATFLAPFRCKKVSISRENADIIIAVDNKPKKIRSKRIFVCKVERFFNKVRVP